VHKAPVVTAGASATFTEGSTPIVTDGTLTVTDSDSIKSATVSITGGLLSGDTLDLNGTNSFTSTTDGSVISASFNAAAGLLTLTTTSGTATAGDYQAALDLVHFSNSGDPTGGAKDPTRTLTWTVVDTNTLAGENTSAPVTSTIDAVHLPPVISGANGVTVTYTEGQPTPTLLDSGFSISNDTLTSATVSVSNFQTGDVLSVGNLDGLTIASNANGTLVLSGVGTSLQYQTALDSISFSEVAGSDPTHGGTDNVRSVTWTIVDDANSTASATTTLDTVHTLSVNAGVTVTFAAGQTGPTVLDSGLAVNDSDTLVSATVSVGGFQNGDILNVTNLDGLTLASDANGTIVLTGTASAAVYQTALQSIVFDEAPGSDPTHGGSDLVRNVTWSVTDSNTTVNHSASAASTLDVTPFPSLSGANGVVVTYVEGQNPVVLDSAITISGSNTVTSATVSVSGFQSGDVLSVGNLDGLTLASDANGTLVLSGAGSNLQYQTALDSITFSEASGIDPTHGGNDNVRSVNWSIATPQSSSSAMSTLDTVHTLSLTGATTVTFTQGQNSPVLLDAGLQVHDSDMVTSATVSVSGFQSGDILSVGNLDGLTLASNANGTLVLTGSASAAVYQAVLESVSFSDSVTGDPTHGGADAARTVTWSITDANTTPNNMASLTTKLDTAGTNAFIEDTGPFNGVPRNGDGIGNQDFAALVTNVKAQSLGEDVIDSRITIGRGNGNGNGNTADNGSLGAGSGSGLPVSAADVDAHGARHGIFPRV
ncbi:MAG: hypothetical protein JOZ66_07800, partial [Hyphomicrobiales bacterium]|nr:hypothetical protein [Hyphomicrobiales bacterium]